MRARFRSRASAAPKKGRGSPCSIPPAVGASWPRAAGCISEASRMRRALLILSALVLLIAPAAADDLAGDARKLLATGMKPDAAALQLMQQGAYPEDAAAALF